MTTFTDEEINQILQEFYAKFADHTYIGARYVPILGRRGESSTAWDDSAPYEPLTIVTYQGDSYTSRQYVPAGVAITNTDFWAQTGSFDAQVNQLQDDMASALDRIGIAEGNIDGINGDIDALELRTDAIEDDVDGIETTIINDALALKYNGNAYILHNLIDVNENLSVNQYHNVIAHSKRDNMMHFDLVLRNATENTIATSADLITIKNAFLRYSETYTMHLMCEITRYTEDYSVDDLANRVVARPPFHPRVTIAKSGNDAVLRIVNQILPNTEIIISGVESIVTFQSWFNSAFYDSAFAESICDYCLNGDGETSWEGTFEFSDNNSVRLDPTNLKTNASGIVYIAYDHFGFHPKSSTAAAYLTNGMFIAYAPAGQPLDVSKARPGDMIIYQLPSASADSYQSWQHVSLYIGNDKVCEMAETYPEAETLNGATDGFGPYEISTPASTYRMTDETNSITSETLPGYNRCIVRFI